ncbi:hypothetical protein Mal15_50200 [Stieleria maiorica]|uniref:PEP-CTERM protein-sorting domain-containing protein n=2 Tax=Stieleria maiorica TaxID=2795974 RepID=A0A5B9MJA2_9BACT|nr:hypothetical protein Mal15_50200 [Stieleria maiorica]
MLVCSWLVWFDVRPCPAVVVAYLTPSRAVAGEQFESDLMLAGSADAIGDVIELINVDIVQSTINTAALSDYSRVRFDARPQFALWHDGQQFGSGSPGFESQIVLDSFLPSEPIPYEITTTDPFSVGTLTFDFGGLGLQPGDTITLDILGRDDGTATRTTSIAIRASGASETTLVNPAFSSPNGSEKSVFTIATAIPEPGPIVFLATTLLGAVVCRRSRRRA